MESFEQKALDVFGEIVINKGFVHEAGFGSKAIPTYVREWIIAHYVGDEIVLSKESREKIASFVSNYLPDKSEKETIKNLLFEQNEVQFLDNYAVYVNLVKGDRYLQIPFLDENSAYLSPKIVTENEMLLSSGLWGVGKLFYIPPSDDSPRGQVWMREFQPFQLANVDIDYFRDVRKEFTINEWLNLIVSSMGFNFKLYSNRQKILLLCRLLPMVEPRYNLVELAPKGTGKSFVFENMSRYVAVRSGSISPAVLFFNDSRKTPGLITRYDCVVIDEAQKVKSDTTGELTALLKSYLESGRFGRGSASSINAEAGIVLLANIDLDRNQIPIEAARGLFKAFPNFLHESAFIDRLSGLLPGWELPKIRKDTPSKSLGLKGDIFGEILHILRNDISYRDIVKMNIELSNCDEMRDVKAIEAGATGLLKVLFPNKDYDEFEFYKYCVNPAVELRQRIRDELCKIDREYQPFTIKTKFPNSFQESHVLPIFSGNGQPLLELIINKDASQNRLDGSPEERILKIGEGEMGHSYKSIFGNYLDGATEIKLIDPYIRLEYQIRNFISFVSIIPENENEVKLKLVTSAEDDYQENILASKFLDLKGELIRHNIVLDFEFNKSVHARSLELNNGWLIKMDRGIDIYQRPESKYGLSDVDQSKRKCRETEIIFLRSEVLEN